MCILFCCPIPAALCCLGWPKYVTRRRGTLLQHMLQLHGQWVTHVGRRAFDKDGPAHACTGEQVVWVWYGLQQEQAWTHSVRVVWQLLLPTASALLCLQCGQRFCYIQKKGCVYVCGVCISLCAGCAWSRWCLGTSGVHLAWPYGASKGPGLLGNSGRAHTWSWV